MHPDIFLVHTLSALFLKISHLIAGILLCFLGKGLFERGIKADFTGEGSVSKFKFRLITSSPGALFLISGLAIVLISITKQMEYVESSAGNEVTSRFLHDEGSKQSPSASNQDLSPEASNFLSLLTIYTKAYGTAGDDKAQAVMLSRKISTVGNPESIDSTKRLLKELLIASPSSLLHLLQESKYAWILNETSIVEDLNQQLTELCKQIKPKEGPK